MNRSDDPVKGFAIVCSPTQAISKPMCGFLSGANQSATVEQAIPDEENGSKVEIFVLSATAGG
jgi:hypothetical protein